jgi:hypothetical protein
MHQLLEEPALLKTVTLKLGPIVGEGAARGLHRTQPLRHRDAVPFERDDEARVEEPEDLLHDRPRPVLEVLHGEAAAGRPVDLPAVPDNDAGFPQFPQVGLGDVAQPVVDVVVQSEADELERGLLAFAQPPQDRLGAQSCGFPEGVPGAGGEECVALVVVAADGLAVDREERRHASSVSVIARGNLG